MSSGRKRGPKPRSSPSSAREQQDESPPAKKTPKHQRALPVFSTPESGGAARRALVVTPKPTPGKARARLDDAFEASAIPFVSPERPSSFQGPVDQLVQSCLTFLTARDLGCANQHHQLLLEYLSKTPNVTQLGLFILSAHYDDVFALTVHMRQHVMDVLGQRYQLHPETLGSLDISRNLRAGVMDNANLDLLHLIGQCMDHDTSKYTFTLFDKVSCMVLASVYIIVQDLDKGLSSGVCKEQFLQSSLLSIMEVLKPIVIAYSSPQPDPCAAGDPLARAHHVPHEQLPRRAAQGRLSPARPAHHARSRPCGGAGPDGFDGGLSRDPAPTRAAIPDHDQALGPAQEVRRLGVCSRHHAQTRPSTLTL